MPTNRRRRLQPRRADVIELDDELRRALEKGRAIFDFNNPDNETLRRAWQEHGKALLAEWAKKYPGRRPFAWWLFVGVPEYGERRVIDPQVKTDRSSGWRVRGILQTGDVRPPIQEPEADYLARHGLLSPAEAQALGKL